MADNSWYKNDPVAKEADNSWYKKDKVVDSKEGMFDNLLSKLKSAAAGYSQGATLGFGDEISGAIRAASPVQVEPSDIKIPGTDVRLPKLALNSDFGEYSKMRDEARGLNTEAATQNPKSFGAGELAPAVLQAAATGGGSLARQAAVNAATSAVNAAGKAEDNVAGEALKSGATAAALTGALPVVGKIAGKGADWVARTQAAKKVEELLAMRPPGWEQTLEKILGSSAKQFKAQGTSLEDEAMNLIKASRSGELSARDFANISGPASQLNSPTVKQTAKDIASAAWEGGKGAAVGSGLNWVTGSNLDPATAAVLGAGAGGMNASKRAGENFATNMASKFATSPKVEQWGNALNNAFSGKGVGAATQLGVREASSPDPFSGITDYLRQAQGASNPAVQQAAEQAQQDPNKRRASMNLQQTPQGRAVGNSESPLRDEDEIFRK